MLNGLSTSASLNFTNVNNTVYSAIQTQETQLNQTMQNISSSSNNGTVSQAQMLELQQQINQWSMLVQIQSTIIKSISDSLKGVIQNVS
jgi:type III secretion protein F